MKGCERQIDVARWRGLVRADARGDLPVGWLGVVVTGHGYGDTSTVLTEHIAPTDVAVALRHMNEAHAGRGGIVACYTPACTAAERWCLDPPDVDTVSVPA